MSYDIKQDFLYSIFNIIIHKIGNIANVFSVNIEAFLSSSLTDFSKTFVYRMREASLSLNSFVEFMRIFLSQEVESIRDNDFWERVISLMFSKNKNLSISKLLNIENLFFRALSVIFISQSICVKSIEERDNQLILDFFDKIDENLVSYLEKRGINYMKKGNSVFILS